MSRAVVVPRVTATGLLLAAARLGQVGLLLVGLSLLIAARFSQSPGILIATVIVTTGAAGLTARHIPTLLGWIGYVVVFVAFVLARRVADETFVPIQHAYVIRLERLLFLGSEPTVWLQRHLHSPGHTSPFEAAMVAVYLSYFAAPHIVAVLVWRFKRPLFPAYLTLIAGVFVGGLVVCFVVPTEPPWLASEHGHVGPVTRIVRDTLMRANGEAYEQGNQVAGTNEVAAMPSLHMAITVAIALIAWRARRSLGIVATIYAVAMGVTLLYTGEHFAIDLLAGVSLSVVVWLAVRYMFGLDRNPAPP